MRGGGSAPGIQAVKVTCVAVPTKTFLPNLRSNRQLEPPLPLNFFYRIFRRSALAPNFSIDPIFRKGDMGSLVHSRECGEPTAVSVTSFHPDLVAEIVKCGSRRLNLRFLALAKYLVYFYCCRTRTRTYHLKKK